MNQVSVLIVDPQPLVAESIAVSLAQHPQFIAHSCLSFKDVEAFARRLQPRIVVMALYDHLCEPGLDACRRLAATSGDHLILISASRELTQDAQFTLQAIEAGADGVFIREEIRLQEFVLLLERVHEGYTILDTQQLRSALAARRTAPALPDVLPLAEQLTQREREVADYISLGKSTAEIAAHLVISERTVQTHVSNILTKLGVHTRAEAAVRLYRWRVATHASSDGM